MKKYKLSEAERKKKRSRRDYAKENAADSPERKARRRALNKEARRRGIYGKREAKGKDLSHDDKGNMRLESASTNRSRNGYGKRPRVRKG